jgi:hypothetical protein
MKVFLSVGATYSVAQESFVHAFEEFLVQNGCMRLTVGRGSLGAEQPILQARKLMETADAVVVLAFTRFVVKQAIEKPGSKDEKQITNTKYPTIWNQLEASMAYGLKLPLLVILEEGLHQEAMLKDRLEFRTWTTVLDPGFFRTDEFKGVFADFKKIALERATTKGTVRNSRTDSLTVGELIRDLRPDQFWKVGTALVSLLAAVGAGAFWLGKTLGRP